MSEISEALSACLGLETKRQFVREVLFSEIFRDALSQLSKQASDSTIDAIIRQFEQPAKSEILHIETSATRMLETLSNQPYRPLLLKFLLCPETAPTSHVVPSLNTVCKRLAFTTKAEVELERVASRLVYYARINASSKRILSSWRFVQHNRTFFAYDPLRNASGTKNQFKTLQHFNSSLRLPLLALDSMWTVHNLQSQMTVKDFEDSTHTNREMSRELYKFKDGILFACSILVYSEHKYQIDFAWASLKDIFSEQCYSLHYSRILGRAIALAFKVRLKKSCHMLAALVPCLCKCMTTEGHAILPSFLEADGCYFLQQYCAMLVSEAVVETEVKSYEVEKKGTAYVSPHVVLEVLFAFVNAVLDTTKYDIVAPKHPEYSRKQGCLFSSVKHCDVFVRFLVSCVQQQCSLYTQLSDAIEQASPPIPSASSEDIEHNNPHTQQQGTCYVTNWRGNLIRDRMLCTPSLIFEGALRCLCRLSTDYTFQYRCLLLQIMLICKPSVYAGVSLEQLLLTRDSDNFPEEVLSDLSYWEQEVMYVLDKSEIDCERSYNKAVGWLLVAFMRLPIADLVRFEPHERKLLSVQAMQRTAKYSQKLCFCPAEVFAKYLERIWCASAEVVDEWKCNFTLGNYLHFVKCYLDTRYNTNDTNVISNFHETTGQRISDDDGLFKAIFLTLRLQDTFRSKDKCVTLAVYDMHKSKCPPVNYSDRVDVVPVNNDFRRRLHAIESEAKECLIDQLVFWALIRMLKEDMQETLTRTFDARDVVPVYNRDPDEIATFNAEVTVVFEQILLNTSKNANVFANS